MKAPMYISLGNQGTGDNTIVIPSDNRDYYVNGILLPPGEYHYNPPTPPIHSDLSTKDREQVTQFLKDAEKVKEEYGEPDMKKFMGALNGCYSTIGKQHDLIQAQENYIMFLGLEISRTSTYLHVHNMKTPDEIVEAGKMHREIIEKAKEKLKP